MKVGTKIKEMVFIADSHTEAYRQAAKYVLKHVINKKSENVTCEYHKTIVDDEPAIRLVINTFLELNEETNAYCKLCKEQHCSFFINENYNCDRCNLKGHLKRVQTKLNTSKNYYKAVINRE